MVPAAAAAPPGHGYEGGEISGGPPPHGYH